MRTIFTFSLILISTALFSQNSFGLNLGYTTDKTFFAGIASKNEKLIWYANFSMHMGSPKGNTDNRNLNLPGTIKLDDGKVYFGGELGAGIYVIPKLMFFGETGLYKTYNYTNYTDALWQNNNNFHSRSESKYKLGVGYTMAYLILPNLSIDLGFNTYTKFKTGVTVWLK